jgi:hypothetical protein
MPNGRPCPICSKPMFKSIQDAYNARKPQWMGKLQYDHYPPLALGGNPKGYKRLTHARCNMSEGGKLSGKLHGNKRNSHKAERPKRQLPEWL